MGEQTYWKEDTSDAEPHTNCQSSNAAGHANSPETLGQHHEEPDISIGNRKPKDEEEEKYDDVTKRVEHFIHLQCPHHKERAEDGTYSNWEWDELDPAMEYKFVVLPRVLRDFASRWCGTSQSTSKSRRVVTEHTLSGVRLAHFELLLHGIFTSYGKFQIHVLD